LALVLALVLPAAWLPAKVYFVNKGVKYHIGDDRSSASTDSDFLDTYPVVGAEWIQGFTVSEDDVVKVHIEEVWGVDDCPYCKVMIDIDGHEMGRLFEEDNHKPFDTPGPLAMQVHPGHTYQLRVSSRSTTGSGNLDDMAFEGVSIETDHASVVLLEPGPILRSPGEPAPVFREPKAPVGPCEGAQWVEHWLPAMDQGRALSEFRPVDGDVRRLASASLPASSFVRLQVKAEESAHGDAVSQYLELMLGSPDGGGEPDSGWVLSFAPGQLQPKALNAKLGGRYRPKTFSPSGWHSGWNELRLARCPDGTARLWINGIEQPARIQGLPDGPLSFSYRSAGLGLKVAEKPL
jgi:hypothetical protein